LFCKRTEDRIPAIIGELRWAAILDRNNFSSLSKFSPDRIRILFAPEMILNTLVEVLEIICCGKDSGFENSKFILFKTLTSIESVKLLGSNGFSKGRLKCIGPMYSE